MSAAGTRERGAALPDRERASQGERSYYGHPVIKEPIWHPEIPWYFFAGGLGGASAGLAWLSGVRGNELLARRAWMVALTAVSASPALLIADLGVPSRFLNMLRMFKVTSPMSVGSWILAGSGASTGIAALDALLGVSPALRRRRASRRLKPAAAVARPAAALLGLPLSTYTGALIAQTAVPAWHEARRELPVLFAAGAAASAGAAATIVTPVPFAAPARRLAVLGSAAELVSVAALEQRLDDLAEPYHTEAAGSYGRLARALTATGAFAISALASRSRTAAVAGGTMVLAGAICERWSVFKAGFQSAREPRYTVGPQRRRIAAGLTRGASRRVLAEEG
ncbi:MAG: NrfD/PsrC family molybdoenzyme membrane anchor subunit [Solirubrobacteraceae bacterium]